MLGRDQRLAPTAGLIHHPAAPRRLFIDRRIARRKQSRAFIDDQGHALTQLQRPTEECVCRSIRTQENSLTLAAGIERLLNPHRIQFALVRLRETSPVHSELCLN